MACTSSLSRKKEFSMSNSFSETSLEQDPSEGENQEQKISLKIPSELINEKEGCPPFGEEEVHLYMPAGRTEIETLV